MRLIHPKFEIIEQQTGLEGIYKQIELCGRVAYKSEDKITEDSAKKFVEKLIAAKHLSPLEHGTIYLHIPIKSDTCYKIDNYIYNKYSICKINKDLKSYCISTNYRVLIEHNHLDDLQYQCKPTEFYEKRITVRLILDRAIAMEFLRHRKFSFTMESTRFCNYSKGKFNKECTFIIPSWLDVPEGAYTNIGKLSSEDGEYKQIILHENNINAYPLTTASEGRFLWYCLWAERDYFNLLYEGWQPQQARAILPNALKTELIMTGFIEDWKHFFSLRSPEYGAKGVHPDAAYLADKVYTKFKDKKYL